MPESCTAESTDKSGSDIDEPGSILVRFVDGDNGTDEAVSDAGPKRTVLCERGLSKMAARLPVPGRFCIKEIF